MKEYVLVTASSRGLGLEIAKELSFSGYHIILTSRSKKNLKEAKKLLNPELKHKSIKIDFAQDNIEKKLIQKIQHLNICAIVHNFGTNLAEDKHPINTKVLEESIYNNFTVSVKINNALSQSLVGKLGKIIHIGSTASLHTKASPAYTLSKGLINTYVKNISDVYIKNKIMICALLPGILAHEGSVWAKKKQSDTLKYERVKLQQPLGRFLMPKDIASYVVDLVKQKSLALSGSLIKLDANDY